MKFELLFLIFSCITGNQGISHPQSEWTCLGDEVSQYQAMVVLEYPTSPRAWMSLAYALEETGRCLPAALLSADISSRIYSSCMCHAPDMAQRQQLSESRDSFNRILAGLVNATSNQVLVTEQGLDKDTDNLCCAAVLELEQRGSSHVLLGGHFSGSPKLEAARLEAALACPRYFGQVKNSPSVIVPYSMQQYEMQPMTNLLGSNSCSEDVS
jgi:hypothetical protein